MSPKVQSPRGDADVFWLEVEPGGVVHATAGASSQTYSTGHFPRAEDLLPGTLGSKPTSIPLE